MRRLLFQRFVAIAAWMTVTVTAVGCSSLARNRLDQEILTARQLSLRATEAMQQSRWGDAESLISVAVRSCPTDERMRAQYAEVLWNLNARESAIQHMQLAVRLSGGNPDLLVRLGDMYLEVGDLERAGQQAERAIAANRQLASAWALRGDVLRLQGEQAESLASYHRALSFQPHYPRVQLAIAENYRHQGRHARSLATLRHLADGYPVGEVPAQVRFLEGLAQKDLGRYEDAIGSFTAAIRKSPGSPEFFFHLAETHWRMGDPVNARIALNSALAVDPAHPLSHQLVTYLDHWSPPSGAAGPAGPLVARASGTRESADFPSGSAPSGR
jgi:tetratricopeptide (TPR) repeat protein